MTLSAVVCGALEDTECNIGGVRYGITLSKGVPVEFGGSEPTEVGQRDQGDIHVFLSQNNGITDFLHDSGQSDGSLTDPKKSPGCPR